MNTVLWIVQGLLAFMFLMGGLMKATQPIEKIAEKMPWANDVPGQARLAGYSEVLGAIGLILPGALGIAEFLTPLAAGGLAVIMLLAAFTVHKPRGETQMVGMNMVLFALAAFVAYGRSGAL